MLKMARRTHAILPEQIAHCPRHDVGREDERLLLMHVALLENLPQSVSEGIPALLVFPQEEIEEDGLEVQQSLDALARHELDLRRVQGLLEEPDRVLHLEALQVIIVCMDRFSPVVDAAVQEQEHGREVLWTLDRHERIHPCLGLDLLSLRIVGDRDADVRLGVGDAIPDCGALGEQSGSHQTDGMLLAAEEDVSVPPETNHPGDPLSIPEAEPLLIIESPVEDVEEILSDARIDDGLHMLLEAGVLRMEVFGLRVDEHRAQWVQIPLSISHADAHAERVSVRQFPCAAIMDRTQPLHLLRPRLGERRRVVDDQSPLSLPLSQSTRVTGEERIPRKPLQELRRFPDPGGDRSALHGTATLAQDRGARLEQAGCHPQETALLPDSETVQERLEMIAQGGGRVVCGHGVGLEKKNPALQRRSMGRQRGSQGFPLASAKNMASSSCECPTCRTLFDDAFCPSERAQSDIGLTGSGETSENCVSLLIPLHAKNASLCFTSALSVDTIRVQNQSNTSLSGWWPFARRMA